MTISRETAVLSGAYTMLVMMAATVHVNEPSSWNFALSLVTLYGVTVLSYYIVFEGKASDEWQGGIHLFKEAGLIALIFVPGRITWKTYEHSGLHRRVSSSA